MFVYLENDAIRRVWDGETDAGKEKEREEVVERATKERRQRVTDLTPRDAIGGEIEVARVSDRIGERGSRGVGFFK